MLGISVLISLQKPAWTAVFSVLYNYRIAHHIPQHDDAISYAELSQRCGLSEPDTTRIVRAAVSLRVFEERPVGFVRHNAASSVLATSLGHDAVGFATEEYGPAAVRYTEALRRFPASDKANESPCAIFNGSVGNRDVFSHISHDKTRVDRVANAVSSSCG